MRTRSIVSTIVLALIPLGIIVSWQSWRQPVGTAGRIDDISVSAEHILRGIADAADVQVLVRPTSPTQRIIHIADAHYVDQDEFNAAAHAAAARRGLIIDDFELSQRHDGYADDIARLHDAQFNLLCALVDRHHLRHLFRESLFEEDLPLFQDAVEQYRTIGPKRDEIRREIEDVTREIARQGQNRDTLRYLKLRRRLLRGELAVAMNLGPACNLVIVRPFVRVLPAEDKEAYEAAGREFNAFADGPAQKAREAAIVRRLLAHKPCSVVVLGRAHDLSREIEEQSGGSCEYIKVVPKGFPARPLEPLFATGHDP